jgi:hypothetical protein
MTSNAPKPRSTRKLAGSTRNLAGQVDKVKGTALEAHHTVESMPKAQGRTVASFSLVTGAALWALGAPRLLTILAFLPALAVGGLKMARRTA